MDFLLVETISSVQRFLLLIKTVTAISESQFLRKDHILTNVTDFLANGNQLLPFFQKEVNCCQWKQFLLQLDNSQSSIRDSGNDFFVYQKHYCVIASFSLLVETIIEVRWKSVFKDEPYSCQRTPIFKIFQRFFKVGATFSYSGNIFFNKSFIRLVETDLLSSGNSAF